MGCQVLFKELDTPGKHSSRVEHRFDMFLRSRHDMKPRGIDMEVIGPLSFYDGVVRCPRGPFSGLGLLAEWSGETFAGCWLSVCGFLGTEGMKRDQGVGMNLEANRGSEWFAPLQPKGQLPHLTGAKCGLPVRPSLRLLQRVDRLETLTNTSASLS